ncbi:hypothetical protein MRX96_022839 [Rhipicephalus microplus]
MQEQCKLCSPCLAVPKQLRGAAHSAGGHQRFVRLPGDQEATAACHVKPRSLHAQRTSMGWASCGARAVFALDRARSGHSRSPPVALDKRCARLLSRPRHDPRKGTRLTSSPAHRIASHFGKPGVNESTVFENGFETATTYRHT